MAIALRVTSCVLALVVTSCATNPCNTKGEIEHDATALAEMNRVEAALDEAVTEGDRAKWPVEFLDNMKPHELYVVGAHFYDERPTPILGSYDNGDRKVHHYGIGDALFSKFQSIFYPDRYVYGEPDYLETKEAALAWMKKHDYNLDALHAEFKKDRPD